MTARTCGSEFFNTWRVTAHSESPLARKVCTKSWLRTSATAARVVRDRMPTGIIDRVTTGSTRNLALLHSRMWKPVEPFGPMPVAGSSMYSTAKKITSTMPSQ